ncbi:hypothetical protein HUJ04_010357 [Dendroctonus ponderosae]|nr:hypothetical protein HUJ04_010357 [Dendroctonus ponderosae]
MAPSFFTHLLFRKSPNPIGWLSHKHVAYLIVSRSNIQFEHSDVACIERLAPGVIIYHETQYTDVLNNHPNVTPEDILRQNFADLGSNCEEFSFIKYIGVKTRDNQETSCDRLSAEIQKRN